MADPLATARDVIAAEIEGLRRLSDTLNGGFLEVARLLDGASGRVMVTGIGKSGHVARKIAATLASTGKPATFIHPAEASHGDLGMITRADAILALSKSGETSELRDLLAYAKRFSIPVAALTCGAGSTLDRAADATWLLPPAPEACGETRAPTTSTTMMMAAGDAIAVALLRARGFTADDFQGFHPGGNLGAALRRVSDMMHVGPALPICDETTPIEQAVALMTKARFGCVGIVDGKKRLAGILTDGDLRRLFGRNVAGQPISAVMTKNPRTVRPDTLAGEALAILSAGRITSLFVIDEKGAAIGLLHVHDCLSSGVL
ncbi:MAG: SIS domain-containing protein [Amphiplicatus sp.]